MTFDEIKQLVEYAKEQKVYHMKVDGLEFVFRDDAFVEPVVQDDFSDQSPEEIARTLREKAAAREKKHLKELFNL